jgi:MFS transporter, OPA family, sugar phosphate sensor protein UhpC
MSLIANWIQRLRQPAPITAVSRQDDVEASYKYWRWRIFIGMYVGYVFFYFSRNSFNSVKPLLLNDLGFLKSDLGILTSVYAISYGLSKFLSGVLSDRSNPRIFMSVGLVITGILNIVFGLTSSLTLLVILWGLNGWFQGWGWPPCAKLMMHWYSQKERGRWWGMQSSSQNTGAALIPLIVGIGAQAFGWRYGMYAAGIMSILIGIVLFIVLRDTPETMGLPPIEKFKKDGDQNIQANEITVKDILFKYILNNVYLWMLGIAYFFVYVIRGAFVEWSPLFLMETRGYQLVVANAALSWFEAGGLIGALVAGWASDKIFQGKRGPVNVLYCLAIVVSVLALWLLPPTSLAIDYLLVFVTGFLVFGPQMLIGMFAVELSHKKAAGGANGFIGFIAYLGWANAGYPLAKIMEWLGWNGFFVTLALCAIIAALLLVPFWAIKFNPKYAVPEEKSAEIAS